MVRNMRKRKLHFDKMVSIFDYVAFKRGTHTTGIRGCFYVCDKPLTDAQRKELEKYNNVDIGSVQYRYAPEIKHDAVFVGDKCF